MSQPQPEYKTSQRKKGEKQAVNLSVDKQLLQQARKFGLNLSQILEQALGDQVRQQQQQHWIEENRDAVSEYNARIEEEGAFGDKLRSF